jgi:hypothetical protein
MTYIKSNMQLNFNYNNRRYNGSSKSWVRVPVTALKSGNFSSLLSQHFQSSFDTSSSRKTIKIFKRSFRNKYACRNFMRNLNSRFLRRFNKNVSFKINLRGTKIEYFNKPKIKELN